MNAFALYFCCIGCSIASSLGHIADNMEKKS